MYRIILPAVFFFIILGKVYAGDPFVTGWVNLGSGTNAEVSAITKYNGNIIAGGHFTNAGGVAVGFIAEWNGTGWSALGNGVTGLSVEALTVYNGELIAGGEFSNASGVPGTLNIAKWNGTNWSALGSGLNDEVKALYVYNGELYAGGSMDGPGGSENIAKWNGTSWSGLGTGLDDQVHAITEYQGNLIVGGRFDMAGGVTAHKVARWNGTTWSAINSDDFQDRVFSLAVYNDTLYVGGRFENVQGQTSKRFLVKLAGSTWQQVGGVMEDKVMSMTVFKNKLVIGGDFKSAGPLTVYRIASWNGSSWSRFSTGMDSTVYALYQNINGQDTTLFAGGELKYAGGRPANNIAEWRDSVRAYSMEGTVRYANNNQPVTTGGYVKAVRIDLNTLGVLTLDSAQINPADGTYRLNNVRGDTVDIIAFPNDVKEYDFAPTYHSGTILWEGSTSINLESDTTGIDIAVQPADPQDNSGTGTISGIVDLKYTPNGFISPLGYEFRSQSIVYGESGTTFRSFSISNNDDYYEMSSLPAGTYKVIANRLGYTSDTIEVTLTNGGNQTVNFSLMPNLNAVSVQNISNNIPDNITLYQNYPNPFNPTTNIRFDIKNKTAVTMYLYNSLGQVVQKMINNETYSPGSYELTLDASGLASGVYFYKLVTNETSFTKKMVVLK